MNNHRNGTLYIFKVEYSNLHWTNAPTTFYADYYPTNEMANDDFMDLNKELK